MRLHDTIHARTRGQHKQWVYGTLTCKVVCNVQLSCNGITSVQYKTESLRALICWSLFIIIDICTSDIPLSVEPRAQYKAVACL